MERVRSTGGIDLTVHDLGPDRDGRPALLAHATGFHGRVWAPLARRLTGLRCWAPDLRAHGTSTIPAGHELRWDRFADDVLAVVDGLHLDRPVGVGHSKGGASLLLAEARRPGTFAALWLYEPVVIGPAWVARGGPNPLAEGARRRRASFGSAAEAEAHFAAKPPFDVLDPEALHEYVAHGFAPDADGVHLRCRPEDEARTYEMGDRNGAWERLAEVRCPVTVVRGRTGTGPPSLVAADVAERLPNGRLEVHDDLGHFGPLQDPAAMAASVLEAMGAA